MPAPPELSNVSREIGIVKICSRSIQKVLTFPRPYPNILKTDLKAKYTAPSAKRTNS
jgi:hypothetical protein